MWLACFALLSLQHVLPLNPDGIGDMEPTLAFNTVSSFTTNTNLQHYSGETGLSYLSQMIVITFLQFVTAATGMAALRRDHPRSRRQSADEARELLRRHDARERPRPAAAGAPRRNDCHFAGNADDVRRRGQGDHARRTGADHRARRHGGGGGHQAARHERWRLLRSQLRAPVREPDAADRTSCRRGDRHHSDGHGLDARRT